PTWGAVRPTHSAPYIVSSISISSLAMRLVPLATRFALARRTGSPKYLNFRTAIVHLPFARSQHAHRVDVDREAHPAAARRLVRLLDAAGRLNGRLPLPFQDQMPAIEIGRAHV